MWLLFLLCLLAVFGKLLCEKPLPVYAKRKALRDDILEINHRLIPEDAPDSSFLMEGDIIKNKTISTFTPRVLKWIKINGSVIIPYVLSETYEPSDRKIIMDAFSDLQAVTCIRFVNRTNERDYISIEPAMGCFSYVGRIGGLQLVSLDFACLRTDKGKGVVLHELMHVAGFWHEHSRADRDDFVVIVWNDIISGYERNFCKYETSNMIVKYELKSILHYSRYAFSKSGLPTINPKESFADAEIGQRMGLSPSDILRVNKYYSCPQYKPSPGDENVLQNSPHLVFSCDKGSSSEEADTSTNQSLLQVQTTGTPLALSSGLALTTGLPLAPLSGQSLPGSTKESMLSLSPTFTSMKHFTEGSTLSKTGITEDDVIRLATSYTFTTKQGSAKESLAPSSGLVLVPSSGQVLVQSSGLAKAPSSGHMLPISTGPSSPGSLQESIHRLSHSHTFTSMQQSSDYSTLYLNKATKAQNSEPAVAPNTGPALLGTPQESMLSQSPSHTLTPIQGFTEKSTLNLYKTTSFFRTGTAKEHAIKPTSACRFTPKQDTLALTTRPMLTSQPAKESLFVPTKPYTFNFLPRSTLKYMLTPTSAQTLRSMSASVFPRTFNEIKENIPSSLVNSHTDHHYLYAITQMGTSTVTEPKVSLSEGATILNVSNNQMSNEHFSSQPLLTTMQVTPHLNTADLFTTGKLEKDTRTPLVTPLGPFTKILPLTSILTQSREVSGQVSKERTSTNGNSIEMTKLQGFVSQDMGREQHSHTGPTEYGDLPEDWPFEQMEEPWDDNLDANLNPEYLKAVGKRSLSDSDYASNSNEKKANKVLEKTNEPTTAQQQQAKTQSIHLIRRHHMLYNILRIHRSSTQHSQSLKNLFLRWATKAASPSFFTLNTVTTGLSPRLYTKSPDQMSTSGAVTEMYPQQVCRFEQGLCGWMQSKVDDLDWKLIEADQSQSNENHTLLDKPGGGHLLLQNLFREPSHKALLLSPILQAPDCITFWYGYLPHTMGTLNIYVKHASLWGQWHLLWSSGGQKLTKWTKSQIVLSPPYLHRNIQVAVEGVIRLPAETNIVMDNLYVGRCL